MAPSVDSAILKALGLDAGVTKIATHGGSGFSSTFKLISTVDGKEVMYFVKTGAGKDAEIMFRGEHASLNAIASCVPSFCPRSHAHGAMADKPGRYFLATDFLDLSGQAGSAASSPTTSSLSFAAKLAKLHTTPAPAPAGFDRPMFGFPVTTCCGSTAQDNAWNASWPDFYAESRIRHILRARRASNGGGDAELDAAIEATATKVVPRLLGALKESIVPVVVHGDLWNGNHSRGRFVGRRAPPEDGGDGGVEEVVYDASAVYGHSEYELGIMRMFGGFDSAFWREYESLVPKAEPVDEWEDRVSLYELYHHLNHYAIFGGSYRGGAVSIMKRLISKYGKDKD